MSKQISNDITLDLDAAAWTVSSPRVTRGGPVAPLDRALADLRFEPAATLEFTATAPPLAAGPPTLHVSVAGNEHAVVLVVRDGHHSWVLPEPTPTTGRLRGAPSHAPRVLEFRLSALTRHGDPGGRAQVLKFVARAISAVAVDFLERTVRAGLVDMSSPDPLQWRPLADETAAAGSRPRVLLFLHDIFASSAGGFHGLVATREGRDLLAWARTHYDEILGYDHPTLGQDPRANALDLLARLARRHGDGAPHVDIVAHGRGGLVARVLVQELAPASSWPLRCPRLVLVGCADAGTRLAAPERWQHLVDLQTTLAVAAMQTLDGVFPPDRAGALLSGALTSLGALVKHLALHTPDAAAVPGLAAMRPGSPLLTALAGAPWPRDCEVHVVRSTFDLAGDRPGALSDALRRRLADDLPSTTGDLVVDAAAMTPTGDLVVRHALDFAANGWIHHLGYFGHDRTAATLHHWLAGSDQAPIDENIWVVDADDPLAGLLGLWSRDRGRAVVVRDGPAFHVLLAAEVGPRIDAAQRRGEPSRLRVRDALGLTDLPAGDRPTPVITDGRLLGLAHPAAPLAPRLSPPSSWSNTRSANKSGLESMTGMASAPRTTLAALAEMPEQLAIGARFDLRVELAQELLTPGVRTAFAAARTSADPDKRLRVAVKARSNLEFAEPSTRECQFPEPGAPVTLEFPGHALAEGPAEAWVTVHQGRSTLAQLRVHGRVDAVATPTPPVSRASASVAPGVTVLEEPVFTLRVTEFRHGDAVQFHYELEAPDHDLRISDKRDIPDIAGYVDKLYTDIEARWLGCHKNVEAFMRELRAYGSQMFTALLPDRLQTELLRHGPALREILVLSTETHVPWELVHLCDRTTDQPLDGLHFLAQKGLVRWLHDVPVQPRRIAVRPGKLRHVTPTYPDTWALPATALEAAFLAERGSRPLDPAHANDLYDLLEQGGFDLLHFGGHGEADPTDIDQAALLMTMIDNGDEWVPDRARAMAMRSLKRPKGDRPLVFLNACQVGRQGRSLGKLGGFASTFLARGAGLFVAPLWSVGDHPAFTFGEALYRELLLRGTPLAEAVTRARAAAASDSPDATWLAYAVYGHHAAQIDYTPPPLTAA